MIMSVLCLALAVTFPEVSPVSLGRKVKKVKVSAFVSIMKDWHKGPYSWQNHTIYL